MIIRKLQNRLIDYLTKHLLKAVRQKDVFSVVRTSNGSVLKVKGKILSKEHQEKFQNEALSIKDSAVWKLISTRYKWEIYQEMFHEGKSEEDIRAGKMALYSLELIEKLLIELAGL